ncbi:MAG: hypothetical protein AB1505_35795, partial [Candidatus Latescibacterota bacterium]
LSPGGGGGAEIRVPADLQSAVLLHPPLPHPQALDRMRRSAALLALCFESPRGEDLVPGKIAEYAGAGRPILIVAPPHFEARQLVESAGIGLGGWKTAEIAWALQSTETFQVDEAGRASLSRRAAAAAVGSLLLGAADAT